MKFSNKFDRLFLILFLFFTLLIGGLIIFGDQTYPRVTASNLKTEIIPLKTNQIVLTFNRNMDRISVEENFSIKPNLKGKFSWIGKKMAYSFTEPLVAGENLELELIGAKDDQGVVMGEAYQKIYQTAEQNLYFIGSENDQKEKLIKYTLNGKIEILSPMDLIVKDFKVHPEEKLIYLLGTENIRDKGKNDLYEFNTETRELKKIIDGQKEFIFSLSLSPDGKILMVRKGVIQQFEESSLIDPGNLWTFDIEKKKWSEFWNKELYGSELYFSPDSNYLVGRLISGDIIILPVKEDRERIVYLENYAGAYNLSPDGSKLVFVDFDDPFRAHDLLLRSNDGKTRSLVLDKGQIQFPIFDRKGEKIYFLLSSASGPFEKENFLELNPYHLYSYELENGKLITLTKKEGFFEGFFHASTDGKWIAYERYRASATGLFFENKVDKNATGAEIWILDLKTGIQKNLNLKGVKPYLN